MELLAVASGVGREVVRLTAEGDSALFQINFFQVIIAAANFFAESCRSFDSSLTRICSRGMSCSNHCNVFCTLAMRNSFVSIRFAPSQSALRMKASAHKSKGRFSLEWEC